MRKYIISVLVCCGAIPAHADPDFSKLAELSGQTLWSSGDFMAFDCSKVKDCPRYDRFDERIFEVGGNTDMPLCVIANRDGKFHARQAMIFERNRERRRERDRNFSSERNERYRFTLVVIDAFERMTVEPAFDVFTCPSVKAPDSQDDIMNAPFE